MKHDRQTRRRAIAVLGSAGVAMTLGGCGTIIGPNEPPRRYRLTSKSTYPANLPNVNWQLMVEPASAAASINTDRIGLMQTPFRFNYYANANWIDRAPLMVQNLIIESFDNSGAIVGVGPEAIGLRPDFVLKPELREFQAHLEDGAHRVVVAINARLVEMPERQIIAVNSFEHAGKVPAGALDPVIEAFDVALGKVMKRLVLWTIEEGEKAWREREARSRAASSQRHPIRRLIRPDPSG